MKIDLVEVSPRDGLQNEPIFLATEHKLELIKKLAAAGLRRIEATACVSPRQVPQMADHAEVLAGLPPEHQTTYSALVANARGLQTALAAKTVGAISVFTAASEEFVQHNIQCGIDESLARFAPLIMQAKAEGLPTRGYISTVVVCPYQGAIAPAAVARVAAKLSEMGCDELSLGDTIGAGTPRTIRPMMRAVKEAAPKAKLAAHFHDTFGFALANIVCALEEGATVIDASVGGLGGCPFAPGAGGNVATEDVVCFLAKEGVSTGADIEQLWMIGEWVSALLSRPYTVKSASARRR